MRKPIVGDKYVSPSGRVAEITKVDNGKVHWRVTEIFERSATVEQFLKIASDSVNARYQFTPGGDL